MYVNVLNNNYGYAVATYGNYVVVSNPDLLRWNPATASLHHSGTVDVFLYNRAKDEHDYVGTLYQVWRPMDVLMTSEVVSASWHITTENNNWYPDYQISIDKDLYTASIENSFGKSLDMCENLVVVGTPYLTQATQTTASFLTESYAMAEVYDLNALKWTANSQSAATFTIDDPDLYIDPNAVTGSFGWSVSINNNWLAVGSPFYSASNGAVYIYKNVSAGNNYSWSLFQKITSPETFDQAQFGFSMKLNKTDSQYSWSLVVGNGNPSATEAYLYEYSGSAWSQSCVFRPDYTNMPLTFNPKYYAPPGQFQTAYGPVDFLTMNTTNGFGYSVGCYDDSVIIGEPYDRMFYQFSGSTLYQQGSAYIFERCTDYPHGFQLVLKTYGTPTTLYNNCMGWSVDMWGTNAVVGIPKLDVESMTSCYIAGTLNQLHYCNADLQTLLTGQAMLVQKNTGSGQWSITNVYQKKKKYLSPYRDFGYDVAIADESMVVGSPMYLWDSNREINIVVTQSADTNLDDIAGKAYIYNLHNLRDQFHVGNVFYRNGKIVIMTSGSVFDGLFYAPINTYTYEYDLEFESQHTILEKQIICTVDPGEFNVSTNPSSITKQASILDINNNGVFDFQDVDVILRYMQYKNTQILGLPISFDWSSSIVAANDEISLLNYYQANTDSSTTLFYLSQSFNTWENVDTSMQTTLDLNQDNRIDIRDVNIMWKYFSNRLTQENYATFITPACNRRLFSDVMDYLNGLSRKFALPTIQAQFMDYERLSTFDKTGSYLAPMATTIGLYNGLSLVAVAKLGTPIKITPELPINIIIKMDF